MNGDSFPEILKEISAFETTKPSELNHMRKPLLIMLLLLTTMIVSHAQSSLKGTVTDTTEKKNLSNTVVSLLRESDSVLVKFTRADKDGKFSLMGMDDGKYIVMITHPYQGDYFDKVALTGTPVDMGTINLIPKSKLLAEVIIKSGSPIRIKGDTTVYTADSFKVRAGANVEELLRRLPGIQVDKDGKITAMGERVKKVLVDGEEFFGSDPGIATKNLRADAVKEVEVFDKKSDQAEFTGIDDGVKDKTINLKMKQNQGYFGKVELGGGLPDKYNNAVMLNSFKAKRKLAGYGIMSNTGQTNLDWEDAQNYGGGPANMETTDDGGIYITNNDEDSYWGGRNGIPQNWNAGLHFSDKFGNGKQSINSGYKFSKVNAPVTVATFASVFLPDTSYRTNNWSNSFNSTNKHAFNLTLDLNLDSNNSIKWTTKVNNRHVQSTNDFYGESFTINLDTLNTSLRKSNNISDNNSITSNFLWKHKFKKLSRTLSVSADLNWVKFESEGLLYALNKYYKAGILSDQDTIDQLNLRDNETRGLNTKIAYTEPLAKDFYLELSYTMFYNNSRNDRITNEKNVNGKYEEYIDTLSNSYIFRRMVNTPGLNFRVNKKKFNYSFGAAVGFSDFEQENVTDKTATDYKYTNFFPRASFTYKFKPNESIRFNYNGSTNAPSLEQLQPIRVNTDPLNIYIGNPALDQSFRHNFNAGYNFYNVLKERNLWTSININLTEDAFVQSSIIDSFGKRTYQTVNASGVYNLSFYSDYGFRITNWKLRFGLGPTINFNHNIDFINGSKNETDLRNYGLRINLSKWVDKKYDFYVSTAFTKNTTTASVNTAANAEFWQLEVWSNVRVNLPKNFEFKTDANVQVRQKDPRFTEQSNFTTWNASIIKRMLKNNKLEVQLGLYDILNQNRGYQRSGFTETYYNTLRRFWLLTVTWNISKNGKPATW